MISGLLALKAPSALFYMIALLMNGIQVDTSNNKTKSLDFVEFFSGDAEVSKAFRRRGKAGVSFDIRHTHEMDMVTSLGFSHGMQLGLLIRPGGFCLLAPVCSTWVPMSRGSTGRTMSRPLGNPGQACATTANIMVARCVLIVLTLSARGVWWVLGSVPSI